MENEPVVSIIVTFLNARPFFREAVESIFAQTYETWELLLVDDGGSDGSTEIALSYADHYPQKVRYLAHDGRQNLGMSASRNLAIRSAKGEYIAFLDADDVWLPHKLRAQVGILNSRPEAAMLYGRALYWYSWTGNSDDIERDHTPPLGIQADELLRPPALFLRFFQNQSTLPCINSVLVRRAAVERVGGFEKEFTNLYEDQVFLTKMSLSAPVLAVAECWDWYRQHPESACSVAMKTGQWHPVKPNPTHHKFLKWAETYVAKQDAGSEVVEIVRRQLGPYRHPIRSLPLTLARYVMYLGGRVKGLLKPTARRLPRSIGYWLWAKSEGREHWPPVGWVRFGSLRRASPISRNWGVDRGIPIDRHYVEKFLARHRSDVRGRVLEIGDDYYTRRFGGREVTRSDVLHVVKGNPKATIVADLACGDHLPSDTFDCIIATQTLQLIYDVRAAVRTLNRILKPGGVLLATFPGVTQIVHQGSDSWADDWCWGFSIRSAQRLFEEVLPAENLEVEAQGNVLAAVSFLHGLGASELSSSELEYHDPDYQLLIMVRGKKSQTS